MNVTLSQTIKPAEDGRSGLDVLLNSDPATIPMGANLIAAHSLLRQFVDEMQKAIPHAASPLQMVTMGIFVGAIGMLRDLLALVIDQYTGSDIGRIAADMDMKATAPTTETPQ